VTTSDNDSAGCSRLFVNAKHAAISQKSCPNCVANRRTVQSSGSSVERDNLWRVQTEGERERERDVHKPPRTVGGRAFQFEQKTFDSIRFGNPINLPPVH